MSRAALIGNVTAMLADAGFAVSDRCSVRPKSFDVAARRGEELVLLKVLGNIDAFDAPTGREMRRLGTYLEATPMVVGLRTRDEDLKPQVVYFRHGVPAIHPETAMDLFVEGVPPMIYAAPGGLYINLDGELLADKRQERGWSLGRLASELGVSRRTVSKYEDGMNASVEVAVKLEDLFDAPLTGPVDVMEGASDVRDEEPTPDDPDAEGEDREVVTVLTRAGFDVHPTVRAPFKTVSEADDEEKFLTGHSELTEAGVKRARIMGSVGRITRSPSVYVVERSRRESIEGTAIVERDEVEEISDTAELRKLVRERAANEA
ncbi:MAG: transcriptional regulator [Halobacteriaceae archaeon]